MLGLSRKHYFLSFLLVLGIVLAGCSQRRLVDFTIISTKNISLDEFDQYQRGTDRVKGEDSRVIVVVPVGSRANVKEAVDKAIEEVPGAVALLDGVISQKVIFLPFFLKRSFIAEGTPLINPELAALPNAGRAPSYTLVKMNSRGEVESTREIKEKKYELYHSALESKRPVPIR